MPDRITLSRTKGWRLPENTRVVTRATVFGNPFVGGDPGRWWLPKDGKLGWDVDYGLDFPMSQGLAVVCFSAWLSGARDLPPMPSVLNHRGRDHMLQVMDDRRTAILARLPELRGMNLACFCKPGCPCHADVLLELANR